MQLNEPNDALQNSTPYGLPLCVHRASAVKWSVPPVTSVSLRFLLFTIRAHLCPSGVEFRLRLPRSSDYIRVNPTKSDPQSTDPPIQESSPTLSHTLSSPCRTVPSASGSQTDSTNPLIQQST